MKMRQENMNKIRIPMFAFLALCLLIGCSKIGTKGDHISTKPVYLLTSKDSSQPIFLSQDVNKIPEIKLSKNGFQIVLPVQLNDAIPIQVCASNTNASIYNLVLYRSVDESPCFQLGTGVAMHIARHPDYSVPLFISRGNAHNHYSSDRRVIVGSKTLVNVNSVIPLNGATMADTFLVIMIDTNQDKAISNGELWFAKISWE